MAEALAHDLGRMIDAARNYPEGPDATLYWQIGNRLAREMSVSRRPKGVAQLFSAVSRKLQCRFGRDFGERSLQHMVRFAAAFPDATRIAMLQSQFFWTHFSRLTTIVDTLKRDYYTEMCRIEGWSARVLADKMSRMLYERTPLSKQPEAIIRQELTELRRTDEVSPALVLQDPYVLDFLGLAGRYSEKDLGSAISGQMDRFLQELGTGFSFNGQQKRVRVGSRGYYIDLLFYHRFMQRLVAIELKSGEFKSADASQIQIYLSGLNRQRRHPTQKPALGIILCSRRNPEIVECLDLAARGIHVAEYLTETPPRKVLEERLRRH